MLLALNGHCGGIAPDLLRLRHDSTDRCPIAQGMEMEDLSVLESVIEGPLGAGTLGDVPSHLLPPRYRQVRMMARWWLEEWREATTEASHVK